MIEIPFFAALLDSAQTLALSALIAVLLYALRVVRREIMAVATSNAHAMRDVLQGLQGVQANIERLWARIDALEMRQGLHNDVEALSRLKRLADALEAAVRNGRAAPEAPATEGRRPSPPPEGR